MIENNAPFKGKILTTTDFSEASFAAFPYAIDEAKASNSKLTVATVFSGVSYPVSFGEFKPAPNLIEEIKSEALKSSMKKLDELASTQFGSYQVDKQLLQGYAYAADIITEYAAKEKFGLIVIASRGHGLIGRIVLGSVAERVLRNASCPVLLVPTSDSAQMDKAPRLPYSKIVVTTDLSSASLATIPFVKYEAERSLAELSVVHVLDQFVSPELLKSSATIYQSAQEIQRQYRFDVEGQLQQISLNFGQKNVKSMLLDKQISVSHTICEYSRSVQADLIILATRGAGKGINLLGGIAERILQHGPCPVLLVPSVAGH